MHKAVTYFMNHNTLICIHHRNHFCGTKDACDFTNFRTIELFYFAL